MMSDLVTAFSSMFRAATVATLVRELRGFPTYLYFIYSYELSNINSFFIRKF
jgi:hypothetical protein